MFDGVLGAAALLIGVLNMIEINKLKQSLEELRGNRDGAPEND